jgi:hypothetical protein
MKQPHAAILKLVIQEEVLAGVMDHGGAKRMNTEILVLSRA